MNKQYSNKTIFILVIVIILSLTILIFIKYINSNTSYTATASQKNILNFFTLNEKQTPIIKPPLFNYIEILDGCAPSFDGSCVNMRSGPSEENRVVDRLRTGIVLKVKETVTKNNQKWYKIQVDKDIQFPERITSDWYVADGNYIRFFTDEGDQELTTKTQATSTKRIVVNLSKEKLYAYDNNNLFMEAPISAGLELTPTPRGTFTVFKKTPSRYMQGPIPGVSDQYYDLPGVPWDLYFTNEGAVIHGAYWHDNFGQPWSHGCVNLSPEEAKKLYMWTDIGTPVLVQN